MVARYPSRAFDRMGFSHANLEAVDALRFAWLRSTEVYISVASVPCCYWMETAKLNAVNPHAWLADTLTKLVNRWPTSRMTSGALGLRQ